MEFPGDLPRISFSAEVFRVSRAGIDPLSTEGSRAAGRRYNPPRDFGALYCSLKRETAVAEVARNLKRRGIALALIPAGEFRVYCLKLTLTQVLDLADPAVQSRLRVTRDSLCAEDPAETRRIAAAARAVGYQALLVPSATDEVSTNLVLFLDVLGQTPELVSSDSVDFGSLTP